MKFDRALQLKETMIEQYYSAPEFEELRKGVERQIERIMKYYEETQFEDLDDIDIVRKLFLEKVEQPENLKKYDIVDVERVKDDDWAVRRFLLANEGDVKAAFKQLDKAMQWRKEFGVNERGEDDLPVEFIQAGAVFPYHEDKEGRIVIYIRVKVNKKIPQLAIFFRQFLIGIFNRIDEISNALGFTIVFDLNGLSYSNVDMDFLYFLITTMRNHYPLGVRRIIVYNMPRIFRVLWGTIKMWLGPYKEFVKFANGEEIKDYIAEENLPFYMSGTCKTDFLLVPKNCPRVVDVAEKYGFTRKDVEKYMKMFQPHIEEAQKLADKVNKTRRLSRKLSIFR